MATSNTTFTATVGAAASTVHFTFYGPASVGPWDANRLANLSLGTVTAEIRDSRGNEVLLDLPCTPAANQVTNKSEGTWVMGTAADIDAGDYRLKFKFVDANGADWYVPTHPRTKWFTLKMIEP